MRHAADVRKERAYLSAFSRNVTARVARDEHWLALPTAWTLQIQMPHRRVDLHSCSLTPELSRAATEPNEARFGYRRRLQRIVRKHLLHHAELRCSRVLFVPEAHGTPFHAAWTECLHPPRSAKPPPAGPENASSQIFRASVLPRTTRQDPPSIEAEAQQSFQLVREGCICSVHAS